MNIYVNCPCCKKPCKKVLDKTNGTKKEMLFQCPLCKRIIPLKLTKTLNSKLW